MGVSSGKCSPCCPDGSCIQNSTVNMCSPCQPGFYQDKRNGADKCKPCSVGTACGYVHVCRRSWYMYISGLSANSFHVVSMFIRLTVFTMSCVCVSFPGQPTVVLVRSVDQGRMRSEFIEGFITYMYIFLRVNDFYGQPSAAGVINSFSTALNCSTRYLCL